MITTTRRSPETEIRYLRTTLRHAQSVLRYWLGSSPIPMERREGYTRDVLRMISRDLAPKRRRARASGKEKR